MTVPNPIDRPAPPARKSAPGLPALSRRQKAAIVVRFLLSEGADLPLQDLPPALQADLTRQMGAMHYVDRATLVSVVAEFVEALDGMGLAFPGSLDGALDALDGRISAEAAERLRRDAGLLSEPDPWARIGALEIDALLPFFERESTEVAAVLLSKLDVTKAAELLGRLPGAEARRFTYAMSRTAGVTPEAVARIGRSLAAQIDAQPVRAFDDGPDERVGAILNFSPALTRDDVLEGLAAKDGAFAEKVRRAIFTFADIPDRLSPADVPRLVREIDQPTLVTALAAATGALAPAAEFLLGNLSRRMAEQIRDEIGERGTIPGKDGDAAQNTVIAAIRGLEQAGEITLQTPGDPG